MMIRLCSQKAFTCDGLGQENPDLGAGDFLSFCPGRRSACEMRATRIAEMNARMKIFRIEFLILISGQVTLDEGEFNNINDQGAYTVPRRNV